MYVKTVTAEGNIMGDPTSSIRDSDTSFLQLLGFKIQSHQKDKEREREREQRDHNINQTFSGRFDIELVTTSNKRFCHTLWFIHR